MLTDLLQGKAEVIEKVMKQVEPELKQALLEVILKLIIYIFFIPPPPPPLKLNYFFFITYLLVS